MREICKHGSVRCHGERSPRSTRRTQTDRGAKTNAIFFTIVESCKLNKINPREYLKNLVESILHNNEVITPNEFKKLKESKQNSTG